MFNKNLLLSAILLSAAGAAVAEPQQEITLLGTITDTTCDLSINGGQSVFNVGDFKTTDFPSVNTQVGEKALKVTLADCAGDESGHLVVQGLTSNQNNDKNLFVNSAVDTVGFMLKDEGDNQVTTDSEIPLDVPADMAKDYMFKVGMGSTDTAPLEGAYSAPIVISYIVQ